MSSLSLSLTLSLSLSLSISLSLSLSLCSCAVAFCCSAKKKKKRKKINCHCEYKMNITAVAYKEDNCTKTFTIVKYTKGIELYFTYCSNEFMMTFIGPLVCFTTLRILLSSHSQCLFSQDVRRAT